MMRAALLLALVVGCGRGGAAETIEWQSDEAAAFAAARAAGKGVLLDIRSDWCAACDDLDDKTFADPKVAAFVNRHYVALKLDVTAAGDAEEAIQARYDADLLPAVRFLDADGTVRGRIDEFVPPAAFLAAATSAASRSASR